MGPSGTDMGRLFGGRISQPFSGIGVQRVVARYPMPSFPFIIVSIIDGLPRRLLSYRRVACPFGGWLE